MLNSYLQKNFHTLVDNAAEDCRLPAKHSCHQIKLEKPYAAPIQRTDDYQCQYQFIDHYNISLPL